MTDTEVQDPDLPVAGSQLRYLNVTAMSLVLPEGDAAVREREQELASWMSTSYARRTVLAIVDSHAIAWALDDIR